MWPLTAVSVLTLSLPAQLNYNFVSQQKPPPHQFPTVPKPKTVQTSNAQSTDTPAWACIRFHESTNGKYSSNLYQIQNQALIQAIGMKRAPGSYTRQEQNSFALRAYAYAQLVFGDGFQPWSADSKQCGLGR